ncbi:AI-2E family transporter [Candidatus Woesearchaeota archaeon]|nr:AI-2E family transporter [Candidatus Woesearchaeota archaeon]HIH49054.1 AI-2E family transporter [Candidatus Woesearchaeota archaeon]
MSKSTSKRQGIAINKEHYRRSVHLLMFIIVLAVTFILIKPFLTAILTSVIIAYIFYPFHLQMQRIVKNKTLAAITSSFLIILLLAIPLIVAVNTVTKELYSTTRMMKDEFANTSLFQCITGSPVCKASNWVQHYLSNPEVQYYLISTLRSTGDSLSGHLSNFFFRSIEFVVYIFVILFLLFYLFKDGPELIKRMEDYIPMKKKERRVLSKRFSEISFAVIYGNIVTAIIQGSFGMFGFFILGYKNPFLWGLVMMIASLIPFVGPPIIWVPAGVISLGLGFGMGNPALLWQGIGMLIYGGLVISSIDNVLKPKIIGDKANVHPAVIFLGVMGGISVFGAIGFFIGPVVLSLCFTFLHIYYKQVFI